MAMRLLRLCPCPKPPIRRGDLSKAHAALPCNGLNFFPSENRNQALDSFCELVLGRDQADNQIAICTEIVEMARMNVNAFLLDQIECDLFVSTRCRHTQHGVPAAFDPKTAACFLRCELPVEFGEIPADS